MKSLATAISFVLTGVTLLVMAFLLSTNQLEYCGQSEALRSQNHIAGTTEAASPTPAPPQKVVFIQIETDKPDLEVGWMKN
jgi:hypothetical protein